MVRHKEPYGTFSSSVLGQHQILLLRCETHLACLWSCPDELAVKAVWTQRLAHTVRTHQWIWPLGLTLEGDPNSVPKKHGGGGMVAREDESLSNPGIAMAV